MPRGTSGPNRRDFFKYTTLAGAGFWVAGRDCAAEPSKSPNETIHFACIGVGGKGSSDSTDAGKHGNVIAICDVDDNTLDKATKSFPHAARFNDYREMFDALHKSIDAVTVSTPDHNHAAVSAMAMKLGKHCFTQKPLTRTVWEARQLGRIAREMKVVTQMGNQGTAEPSLRKTAALIAAGAVGNVKEVHDWTNRPIWPQGAGRPPEKPVPSQLHWDLWLGTAPVRPFGDGYHPFAWRGFWDFGSGALGDMACHTMNVAHMALDLRNPVSVFAETSGHNRETFPKRSTIRYEFASNAKRPGFAMIWYDGGNLPPIELLGLKEDEQPSSGGILFIGDKGKLYAPGDYCEKGYHITGGVPTSVPEVQKLNHFTEFAEAIKSGKQATSNFPDYAGPLTETVVLGNLAVWAGTKVQWDGTNMTAKVPDIDALIKPTYRQGYTL